MFIDIIIPCKNPDHRLINTIDSIIKIKEISNIIIINDYSFAGQKEFNKAESFEKVTIYKNIFKKGISGALNTGIHFSKNNLISRIDCGDICLVKNRFNRIIQIFEDNKDIELVCSGLINDDNKIIKPKLFFLGNTLTPFSKVPHPTWVFKKNALKINYNSKNIRFEDYAFLVENNFNIFIHDCIDIKYDTKENLKRLSEIRVSISKTLFFIKNTKNKYIAFFIGLTYIFLRITRLLITTKKIIF